MRVPPELIDHIFSFLRGEKSTLQACSKAHPIFSRLAKPYIYADILVPTNNQSAVAELHKRFSKNAHLLDFPRTLEFRRTGLILRFLDLAPEVLSVMSMIPRMTNLISLTLREWPCLSSQYDDFLSIFRTCLQQSTIEEICLQSFHYFPLSILDNGKNINKLTLSDCTAELEHESTSTSDPPRQSFKTLIIRAVHNPRLLVWTTHRACSLTTLELRDTDLYDHEWTEFPELLMACSNSLTKLYLDVSRYHQSTYRASGLHGRWVKNGQTFPFTLSAHTHLTELFVYSQLRSNSAEIHCALPAIIRLIKSAVSIPDVVLKFDRSGLSNTTSNDPFDFSPLLGRLCSDFPITSGIRPRIDLHISDVWASPLCQIIPDVLAMKTNGLVNQDVVS